MDFEKTAIPNVILITPKSYTDSRGFFMETFQKKRFSQFGIAAEFVQDNQSGSYKGVLRGLHYQIQHAQGKLIRAVSGEIFDVAVDLRKNSPYFGKWVSAVLSAENKQQLWIPPGFAHGFLVMSEWADVVYKATDFYAPEAERSLVWNDPDINIQWPMKPGETPIVSEKDAKGNYLKTAECFE